MKIDNIAIVIKDPQNRTSRFATKNSLIFKFSVNINIEIDMNNKKLITAEDILNLNSFIIFLKTSLDYALPLFIIGFYLL